MKIGSWRRAGALIAGVALLPVVAATPVSAVGIVVNSKSMLTQDDGVCTLPEAVKSANDDVASGVSSGECAAGAGTDIITFSVTGTIPTTRVADIDQPVTIDGGGKVTLDLQQSGGFAILDANGIYLLDLTIANGYSQFGGAFLVGANGVVYVQGSTIRNSRGTQGGAINVSNNGDLYVWDSTISGSTSTGAGGGIAAGTGSVVQVLRSTISGNKASSGGGIYAGGTLDVANSTIAKNTVTSAGGGIYAANGSTATLRNATVALNASTGSAGGFYADSNATTTMRNTILAGNTGGNLGGSLDTSANNIVGGSIATLLDPEGLQDNGGRTKTIKLLSTAAAALDDGDPAVCSAAPVNNLDQRNLVRGNPCDIGAVERDRSAPTATAPVTSLRTGTSLSGTSMRAVVRWSAVDTNGSGVRRYQLQQSVNGGSFSTISSTLTSPARSVTLANGSNYVFRVRAFDKDGNASAYQTATVVKPRLVQQTSSAIVYGGTWKTATSSKFSGGSVKYATQWDDEAARYDFTGSSIALVTTKGPTRGVVLLWVDGQLVGRLDLYSPTTKYRQVVYARTFPTIGSHSIRIDNYGTTQGRVRFDLDAFAVLK